MESQEVKVRELPISFTGTGEVRGFLFRQLSKTNKAFLYKVDSGSSIYYEVFKRLENKRFVCISYPTSKAFGIWAWTYSDINKAIYKLNYLSDESNT